MATHDGVSYQTLMRIKQRSQEAYDRAEQDLRLFIVKRAVRGADKPWEICGAVDAWRPRLDVTSEKYDEDDLVPGVECQLPKDHEGRWHQEWSADGRLLGEWSGPR